MSVDAVTALTRFGLGPRPGDLAALGDPREALLRDITDRQAAVLPAGELPDTATALNAMRLYRMSKPDRPAPAPAPGMAPSTAEAGSMTMMAPGAAAPMPVPMPQGANAMRDGSSPGQLLQAESAARLRRIAEIEIGFAERLAQFWANHFAVDVDVQLARGVAGSFEREAIRPHVLGKFADMLLAVARHPAMLIYLDNARSVGPGSTQGVRRAVGLNENYARETLELHTIGVAGGYTQADVTALARILTGWSYVQTADAPDYGQFIFRRQAHEPGAHSVMGTVYEQEGMRQGEAVLADLAAHPATAQHIATKLVRHFVADDPPAPLVAALAEEFTRTDGDLQAVARVLVMHEEAWAAPSKLRTPQDFVFAGLRALGVPARPRVAAQALTTLGQALWNPPSPEGFDDLSATWLAPDAMSNRVDVAAILAQEAGDAIDPRERAADVLGPRLSAPTRDAIGRAESPAQGLVLMLMSPEFQRR